MPRKKQQYGLGSIFRKKVKDTATGELVEAPRWYIQFFVDGRQYREATGTTIYNEAQKKLKQRIGEVASGHVPESNRKVLVGELLDDLLEDYRQHHPKSLKCFARGVVTRLRDHFGNLRAAKVQTKELNAFVTECQAEPIAPATINRHLSLLRRAYKLATQHSPRKVSPTEVPLFSRHFLDETGNVRRGFFEHADYEKMRDALEGSERAAIVFAYYSGCRLSEILKLRWEQVDFAERMVRLNVGETKSGAARALPMGNEDSELHQMIQEQAKGALLPNQFGSIAAARLDFGKLGGMNLRTPWVFYRPDGVRVTTIRYGWADAVDETGVDRMFHDLRRTAVRNLIRAGVPESVAMAISGHKTRSVFTRYNITDEKDLHSAADKLGAYTSRGNTVPKQKHIGCGPVPIGARFCPGCGEKI